MRSFEQRALLALALVPMTAYKLAECLSATHLQAETCAHFLERSGHVYSRFKESSTGNWEAQYFLSVDGYRKAEEMIK